MMELGFHTDAFTSAFWSFKQCLALAQAKDIHWIECGLIDGVSWIHGLGYHPHVALREDPVLLRNKMDRYGVAFSQVDAAFPLRTPGGATIGLEYVLHSIPWAKLAGCPRIDTTDDSVGMTDREAITQMKPIYERIRRSAEAYQVTINVEPHGYYSTTPDFLAEMLSFVDSPYLRLNLDIGNVYIAGQDPVLFLEQFKDKISHVHAKDVSESLDVEMVVKPVRGMNNHSVIRGVGPMPLIDEAYLNMWHGPGIRPLMEVDHPLNDKPVVYLGPHPAARVVYIQLGHGESTMRHPGYRKLVYNAVLWAAGKVQ